MLKEFEPAVVWFRDKSVVSSFRSANEEDKGSGKNDSPSVRNHDIDGNGLQVV